MEEVSIYIPLWLDLLSREDSILNNLEEHLHSTMVGFIISHIFISLADFHTIYIPLWLDLL